MLHRMAPYRSVARATVAQRRAEALRFLLGRVQALAGLTVACQARARRALTAAASPSSTGTVCAMLMQASVTDTPCASG